MHLRNRYVFPVCCMIFLFCMPRGNARDVLDPCISPDCVTLLHFNIYDLYARSTPYKFSVIERYE